MKELKSLLTEAAKIAQELKRLEQMESDARSAIVAAADEDITTPAAQKRIQDSRLTLDLVAARRSKLKPPYSALHARLQEQFRAEVDAFNNQVVAARTAKESEIVKANLPFHLEDERQFRKHCNFDSFPVMQPYRKAFAQVPRYQNPAEADLVRDVGLLIAHIERWSKKLGI